MIWRSLLEGTGLTALQLPSQCELCRHWGRQRLCEVCCGLYAAARPRCQRCALPVPSGVPLCGDCLLHPPAQASACCVADYLFPWPGLIADLKFNGRVDLAPALAGLLCQATLQQPVPAPDLVLPVPLSPQRLAQRGYNQAWELARRVARRRRLRALPDALARPLDTAHQADLPRAARLRNLRAAFVVNEARRAQLQGRRIALVDDVLTTGATAHEAASTLLRAGASAVDVWVLARTPAH